MNYDEIISTAKPVLEDLPGGWEPDEALIPRLTQNESYFIHSSQTALILRDVLSAQDCQSLINLMNQSPSIQPVSVQGLDLSIYDAVGSHRTTIWSPELAKRLWSKIGEYFIDAECFDEYSATDWWQGDQERTKWEPIGISPMLRFMNYAKGGEHYAHYDAGFIYPDDNYRTLKSVVLYLTTNEQGGATRFIDDWQAEIPVWERNHHDWIRQSTPDEVKAVSKPIAGNALIFNHRECHDVEKYLGDTPRIIIRTDILYKAAK